MLTLAGDAFPNRVAASLYASFDTEESCGSGYSGNTTCPGRGPEMCSSERLPPEFSLSDLLVGHSQKEFEDTAVRLMSGRTSLRRLGNELAVAVHDSSGVFDSRRHTMHFLHGMESIVEVKALMSPDAGGARPLPHVTFTNQRLSDESLMSQT